MRNNNPKYWETATVDVNVRPYVEPLVNFTMYATKAHLAYLENLYQGKYSTSALGLYLGWYVNGHDNPIHVPNFKTLACIHGQLVDDLGYRIPLVDWLAHLEYEEYLDSLSEIPIGLPQIKLPKCIMLSDKEIDQMLSDFVKSWKEYHIHVGDFYDEPVAVATSPKPPKIPTWLVALILIAVLAIASHALFGYTVVNPQ